MNKEQLSKSLNYGCNQNEVRINLNSEDKDGIIDVFLSEGILYIYPYRCANFRQF